MVGKCLVLGLGTGKYIRTRVSDCKKWKVKWRKSAQFKMKCFFGSISNYTKY
jgi:hypothetical protein